MSREIIFISHVTPKNNYQATWLEAKLTLLGYKVWVDIKDLRGGDSFWPEIQCKIKDQAIKFLPLVTKEYIERANTPRSGVRKEISCADGNKQVDRFIIPLRFDDSSHSDFPIEFQELNGLDFSNNWADGLQKLIKELEEANVPKKNEGENYIKKWFEALEIKNAVTEKEERYYTNWLPFSLPDKIYVHEAQVIHEPNLIKLGYPYLVEGRYIITFVDAQFLTPKVSLGTSYELPLELFLNRDDLMLSNVSFIGEPNKKLVKLLNKIFHEYLKSNNLGVYSQSGDREIFYHKRFEGDKKKISLKEYGRSNKALNGRSKEIDWFYAISGTARLFPMLYFKISHHLFFERDGAALGKDEQQEHRRSVASGWYNKDWLDMLLAFFLKLKNSDSGKQILIPLSAVSRLVIDCEPFNLVAKHGYIEPNTDDLEAEQVLREEEQKMNES